MSINKGNIGNALHSVAPDHVVVTADDIYDETLNKYQSELNQQIGHGGGGSGTVTGVKVGNGSVNNPDSNGVVQIPAYPAEQIQSDWNQTNTSSKDYIKNKPNLSVYQLKESGKGLSTNDYTTSDKSKLDLLPSNSQLNTSLSQKADASGVYSKSETYSKTELDNMITTPSQKYVTVEATSQTTSVTSVLPSTGESDTVYRVGNWDGTQYDTTVYTEYAWNGSSYKKLSTKNSDYGQMAKYAFENSASVFSGEINSNNCLLDIDTNAGTVKTLGTMYVLTDKKKTNVTVSAQTVSVSFPSTLELYVVYIDNYKSIKCVAWTAFDSTDSIMVICRFTTELGQPLDHPTVSKSVRLDYTRCPTRINGVLCDLDNIGHDVHNMRFYDDNGNVDYCYFTPGGVVSSFSSCFTLSKYFKVESNISVLCATSPNNASPCCVVYDEYLNVIKTIIATTASPYSGSFVRDITYTDIQDGAYFRWCCDLRYPAVVQGNLHQADTQAPVFSPDELMEEELGGTDNISNWDNICYNDYHEAQGMEVYGIKARFISAVDTKVLLFNHISRSYKEIQTIKANAIKPDNYVTIALEKPIFLKPNQYIGFDRNIRWRSNSNNGYHGCFIHSANTGWETQPSAALAYGLYVRPIESKKIRKTISVITDSIGTDNYVTQPSRNYWKSLISHTDMQLFKASTFGGTCVMQGIRSSGVSFTDQSRWGNLFDGGTSGKQPDIILVQGGVNDFCTSPEDANFVKYAEIGSIEDSPSPTTSFYSAYKYLLQQISVTYPDAQIVCCTPPKMFDTQRLSSVQPIINKHGLKMSRFVDAVKEVAREYGAVVVDLFGELPTTKDNYRLYMKDTFHPKDEGCVIIENQIINKLLNI